MTFNILSSIINAKYKYFIFIFHFLSLSLSPMTLNLAATISYFSWLFLSLKSISIWGFYIFLFFFLLFATIFRLHFCSVYFTGNSQLLPKVRCDDERWIPYWYNRNKKSTCCDCWRGGKKKRNEWIWIWPGITLNGMKIDMEFCCALFALKYQICKLNCELWGTFAHVSYVYVAKVTIWKCVE